MAAPTEELLQARRLRSTELALDGARARLAEAGRELDELRARVDELEGQLLAQEAEFEDERERLTDPDERLRQAQLADALRRRREAEQELQAERIRGEELAARLRGEGVRSDEGEAERELGAAMARIGALEGELESVRRQAAEFEYALRQTAEDAWSWLEALGARVAAAIEEIERLRGAARPPRDAAPPEPRGSAEPVAPERLDEALSRLRARVPAPPRPDAPPPPSPPSRRQRRRFLRP